MSTAPCLRYLLLANTQLANERTYLAWLRTSLLVVSGGIALAQLNRLVEQKASLELTGLVISIGISEGNKDLLALGVPFGVLCVALGIVILLVGTFRFYHAQGYLLEGKYPAAVYSAAFMTATAVLLCVVYIVLSAKV